MFQDVKMKDNLAFIISEVTKLDKDYILENIIYDNTEIPKNNITEKNKTSDLSVYIGKNMIL